MIEVRHPQIKILRSGNNVVYCRLLCVPVLFFWEAKQRNIVVGKSVCAAYSCANLPTLRLALSHDAVAVPLVTRGASSGAITDYAPTSSLSKYSLFAIIILNVHTILYALQKKNAKNPSLLGKWVGGSRSHLAFCVWKIVPKLL